LKITCLPVSIFGDVQSGKYTLRQWAQSAKNMGFDGIDISMLMLSSHVQTYLDKVKNDLHEVGIPIVMATTYPDFTHPDPRQREREADYLMRDIAVCDQLDITYLRVLAGQSHEGVGREEGVKLAVDKLRDIDRKARKYDVKLVFENHARCGAWYRMDFSYPVDIFLDVLDGLRDTAIRLNFDIGNIVSQGRDPLPILEKVIDRVETVHISDMSHYGQFEPVEIGTGVSPIEPVLKRLKAYGYDGWICLEEASGQGMLGIERAMTYLQSVLLRI
jgi:sugar phosphate isomerase/epimerase